MAKKHYRDIAGMQDDELAQLVKNDFDLSSRHIEGHLGKCRNWYAQYRSMILPENIREHGANLFVPYTYQLVETAVPKWFNSLFGTKPYMAILPAGENSEEAKEKADKMNELITYQLDNKIKIVSVGNELLKSVAIYGTAFTKQEWVKQTRKVRKKRPADAEGVPVPGAYKITTEDVVVKDDPSIKVVPIFSFRFDPTGTDIDSCRWCGEVIDTDIASVLAKVESETYKLSKEARDYLDNIKLAQESEKNTSDNANAATGRKKKDVKIYEYYTDEWRVHVLDERFVVLKVENPYFHGRKPYTRWISVGVPDEMFGIGIPECVESLQEELNTTRSQRIDNVSMAINRMWKVNRGSNIQEANLVSKPNGIIWVDDMNDIEEVQMTNVTENAYREEQEIKQDMDMASGVLDSIRGTSTDRRETATTASIMHQSGGDRFQYETTLLDVTGLIDAVGQIVQLNQQFVTDEKYLNLQGDDASVNSIAVKPDDLMGDFDVVAASRSSDPVANKEVQRNQLITLKQTLVDDPNVNQVELTKRILEAFDLKNVDALFVENTGQMPMTPDMMMSGMPTQMNTPTLPTAPQAGASPLDTATPEQVQMVLNAVETGGELPPELLPLAEALVLAMREEENQ